MGCFDDVYIDPEVDHVEIQIDGLKNPDNTAEYGLAVTTYQSSSTGDETLYIIDESGYFYPNPDSDAEDEDLYWFPV